MNKFISRIIFVVCILLIAKLVWQKPSIKSEKQVEKEKKLGK